MRYRSGLSAAALALLSTVPSASFAGSELMFVPHIWVRTLVNDNRRLRPTDPIGVFGSVADTRLSAQWQDERSRVNLEPRFRLTRYTAETDLNAEDVFVHLDGNRRYERVSVQGTFDFERQGTATSELTDSGRVGTNINRFSYRGSGAVAFEVTDRLAVTATGGAGRVSFESIAGSFFQDYETADAGLALRYVLSARTALLFSPSIATFDVPDIGSETVSYAFRAGLDHAFSDSLTMSFQTGQNISRLKSRVSVPVVVSVFPLIVQNIDRPQKSRASGRMTNLVVTKAFERATLGVTWNRFFTPSSQGVRLQRNEVEGDAEYRWTPDLTLRGLVAYSEQESEGEVAAPFTTLEVLSLLGRARYRLTDELGVELTYRFRRQTEPLFSRRASSHEISLGLRFSGIPVKVKR